MSSGPPDAQLRDALIRHFGRERFTLRTYYQIHHKGWPSEAWLDQTKRRFTAAPFLEPAAGPRGGEGWRIKPAVIDQLETSRAAAAARLEKTNEPDRTIAAAVRSAFAIVRVDDATKRVIATYPAIRLHPRWIDLHFRETWISDVIANWFRRHPLRVVERSHGARLNETVISAEWRHAEKLSNAIAALDRLILKAITRSAQWHEQELTTLNAHLRPPQAS